MNVFRFGRNVTSQAKLTLLAHKASKQSFTLAQFALKMNAGDSETNVYERVKPRASPISIKMNLLNFEIKTHD